MVPEMPSDVSTVRDKRETGKEYVERWNETRRGRGYRENDKEVV